MKPLLTVLTLCSTLAFLAPPEMRVAPIFILFFISGFVIVSFTLPQKDVVDLIILSVLIGFAFQIVYAYFISLFLHFSPFTLFLPSLLLSLLFDFKGSLTLELEKKAFLIFVPAIIFGVITLNVVAGEDSIAHMMIINDIVEAQRIPQTYELYPEIPQNMYPLGFHILTGELQLFSGIHNLIFWTASLLSGILCLSVYWCTKKLFSLESGMLAGVLSVFAAFPPLNSLVLSTYTNLLAYLFICAAIGIIASSDRHRLLPLLPLSLVMAAGAETHFFFFLVAIPLSLFFAEGLRNEIKTKKMTLEYLYMLGLSLFLCSPFLVRFLGVHAPEHVKEFFTLWYNPLLFNRGMIFERVGTWITLIGVVGLFLLKKYRIFFSSWILLFLFLAVNSVVRIEFPLWYSFLADRMVDQLFLPFSILGAFFLTECWEFSRVGALFLCGILLVSGGLQIVDVPRADRGELFPTTSPFFATDQEGMTYLLSTEKDSVILNEWWTATGSAWIPALTRRKVVFPYIVNAFSVNLFTMKDYIYVLDLPEKERKSFVIAAFPDSEESYAYLKEWGVDYVFLSSYVLEEAKWRSSLWNPAALEPPNYEIVFQEGYTYLFRVSPKFEFSTTFVLKDFGSLTTETTLDCSLRETSFPVDRILDIYFEDSGWGDIRIGNGKTILAVVPMINSGRTVHVAVRIPENMNEVVITAEDVEMRASVSAAFRNSTQYSGAALVGEWRKGEKGYELMDQGHIYVFNTSNVMEIAYVDTGEGNVDLNVLIEGEWEKLTTIYRENDGKTKKVLLNVPGGYTLLDIGLKNWGDPFVVIELSKSLRTVLI